MERYKLEIVNNHGDRYIRCEPAPDGSWVMFRDVAALQARVAELEGALLTAKQHFVADEPIKAFVEICAALTGGKDE